MNKCNFLFILVMYKKQLQELKLKQTAGIIVYHSGPNIPNSD